MSHRTNFTPLIGAGIGAVLTCAIIVAPLVVEAVINLITFAKGLWP